jgi:hypothetical protein
MNIDLKNSELKISNEMERTNWFIENKAIFGAFPIQESVNELEKIGVRYFLDLTRPFERGTIPYYTKYNYENYPIFDRSCPIDRISFGRLIVKYGKIINNLLPGELVYIHCRGGHGRSGLVASCLLAWIFKMSPQEAMDIANNFHAKRSVMREKWRKIGVPQTRIQKNFVLSFFKPIYITKQRNSPLADIFDGVNINGPIEEIFSMILEKFRQDNNLISDLLNTGLSKIIFVSANSPDNREKITKILAQVRTYFFHAIE